MNRVAELYARLVRLLEESDAKRKKEELKERAKYLHRLDLQRRGIQRMLDNIRKDK